MMSFLKSALLLFAVPVLGQTLNSWRQPVIPSCCGTDGHYVDQAVDGNPDTYNENDALPAQLALLFNRMDTYLGFYIQSSGSYITDYEVSAYDTFLGTGGVVGRVSDAKSNFTVVNFHDADGTPQVRVDTIFVSITGTQDGAPAIVNEIYPIYPGDTIVYPAGQSASPSPIQSPDINPTPTSSPYQTPPAPTPGKL